MPDPDPTSIIKAMNEIIHTLESEKTALHAEVEKLRRESDQQRRTPVGELRHALRIQVGRADNAVSTLALTHEAIGYIRRAIKNGNLDEARNLCDEAQKMNPPPDPDASQVEIHDFLCNVCDAVWGDELGWTKPGALESLAKIIRSKCKSDTESKT